AATVDFSLDVREGHIHALIGPNGAGKTTLVNQLSGDILPDAGSIRFGGTDITRLKPHARACLGLARSYQITSVFEHLSVAENLALAILAGNRHNFRFWRRALNARRVRKLLPEALARFDLEDSAHRPAGQLSHGEKRQLDVGMTLVGRPRLLILDEPMAGLGPGGTVELSKLIRGLKGQLTILLVEHDMKVVFSLADMITVLVNGQNVATGTPDEIRANDLVRSAYLGEEG
ncbi:MAG: ABC transporter ATP-binding protein, partial [Deltaproteobacteria bacterium]|nr:ABC transporter ATP-binding protein [Deltaproteobacteria bacterium]